MSYLVGFFAVYFIAESQINQGKSKLSLSQFKKILMISWFAMIFGARLFYVVFYYPSLYIENPSEAFAIWNGGMSFHGGLIGVALACYFYAKNQKISIFQITDLVVLGVGIGLMLGRISNFMNAELVGRPSELPWAVIFPNYDSTPRHPSQIYEAIFEGLLLNIFLWKNRFQLKQPGKLSSLFLIFYAIVRFFTEFTREADLQLGYFTLGLSLGQILCIAMLSFGFMIYPKTKHHALAP